MSGAVGMFLPAKISLTNGLEGPIGALSTKPVALPPEGPSPPTGSSVVFRSGAVGIFLPAKISLTNGLEGPIGALSANTVDAAPPVEASLFLAASSACACNAAVVAGSNPAGDCPKTGSKFVSILGAVGTFP